MTNYILWVKTKDNPFWHKLAGGESYRTVLFALCDMRGKYVASAILPEGQSPND